MEIIVTIFFLILSLFSSCVPGSDELLVDGRYNYQSEKKTMEKLMEYVQAGDADTIYQVFSQTARERSDNLPEKIEEFITFVNEEMVSWEYRAPEGGSSSSDEGGIRMDRSTEFYIYTDETRYLCSICDVMMDDFNTKNEGFSSITVIPVGWHDDENGLFDMRMYVCAYGNLEEDGMGLFLSYPGETCEEGTLERLLDLAANQDSGGIYDLYSDYAKETVPDLPEQAEALVEFLQRPIRSWEFYDCAYSCVTEWVQLPGTEAPLLRRGTAARNRGSAAAKADDIYAPHRRGNLYAADPGPAGWVGNRRKSWAVQHRNSYRCIQRIQGELQDSGLVRAGCFYLPAQHIRKNGTGRHCFAHDYH